MRKSIKLTFRSFFGLAIATGITMSSGCNTTEIIDTSLDIATTVLQANPEMQQRGIRETLKLSSTRAADILNREGAYFNHPTYKILLPQEFQQISANLRRYGLGSQVDKIERLMNQGAERAASEAKQAFINAVRNMTINDALNIIQGHDTAATDYFRRQTYTQLQQRYQPIVNNSLQQIGFYQEYQQFLSIYKNLPLRNKPELDLEQHVIERGLSGLFQQVAEQEKLIRQDPVGRGNVIIGQVFAGR